ncbi:uncharacterized protein PRCAT00000635001 [Priceomyces carsonii]|uniref:uncharacterized protein n=1 Tax=Priceomyces carsonii TaxID=28549 RepID=UPI002ED9177B|nr:unnamed protein product [Priceomyces carsonii]
MDSKEDFDQVLTYPSDYKTVSPKDFQDGSLKMSGRILNVMTQLPTQICKRVDSEGKEFWDLDHLTGNSALYSSQYFLDQRTDWETHLIAWTGNVVNKTSYTSTSSDNIQDDPLYLIEHDKKEIESKIRKVNKSDRIHPIWLLKRNQQRWRNYAENVLWPLFHYIQGQPSDGKLEAMAWRDYVKFNESYFNVIKSIYKPGDIIWIHDYYLLLLPQLLRMEFPDAYIGLYMHVPFPSSEYFRCLSKRSQLLDGMLGADKIAFQSHSFQRHFLSCCSRLLGCEVTSDTVSIYGFTMSVETLPIGIDTKKIEHDAFSSSLGIEEKVQTLKEIYADKKIIVGRDRLDAVRGVVQKLEAYGMFLEMYPEWRDKVVLIQVLSPGYSHSAQVEKQVTELVNHINSEFGNLNYTPVVHFQMRINKDEYLALLRVADMALVTAVRDGMSTTSLEFVICQKENHSPLILSEFTGTASVLKDAILVNPWDSVGIAKTINDSFLMSAGKKKMLEDRLYKQVTSNTVQTWTSKFLSHLIEHVIKTHQLNHTPALNKPLLLKNYKNSKRRLFLFDYDGTLTPIVKDPAAAIPSSKLIQILKALSSDPKNQVWVISGRDLEFLEKWLGSMNIGLSAEHGCFMRDIGSKEWINLAASFDMSWQIEVEKVFRNFTERTPGSNIEKKKVALTWHYRRADPELGRYQAEMCMKALNETVANKYDVEVMNGKANIEVRPRFVNKGEIVKRLALTNHGEKQDPSSIKKHKKDVPLEKLPDFMLCLGDDLTDEDMFKSLKVIEAEWDLKNVPKNAYGSYGVYPVVVGPASKKTIATAHLTDPSEVLETLALLVGRVALLDYPGSPDDKSD